MPKLTTRQIIILGVMVLAILYGAYDFLSAGRKKPAAADPAKASADLNAFIAEMTASVVTASPSPVDAYMIKRAEAPWTKDPFYERRIYAEWAPAKEPAQGPGMSASGTPKAQFNYTGFVEGGGKRIAVINGNEYGTGDALDVEDYVLKAITPSRISVYNRETRRTFDIPLQE